MKRNINKIKANDIIPLKKRNGFSNKKNNNSLKYNFFNKSYNRNKISVILNFLDINEQLPLLKLNSILSKILIKKYNLPFKSIAILRKIKNNRNSIESKYSKIFTSFKNIIEKNDFDKEEYQYIISFLLKYINNNFIIFDKINNTNDDESKESDTRNLDNIKIFFEFFSKIKFTKNIIHIKFNFSNIDTIIDDNYLKNIKDKLYFLKFFENTKHLEIDKIENSFGFMNELISFENNSINNIEKINLNDICIKISNEEILNYDKYNSLSIPNFTNLKYIFLFKVNLSIYCLNEIIKQNNNIIKLVINNCSNNNISLYDEKEYNKLINENINKCNEIKHIEFNNNNFSMFLTNKIIFNLIEIFFHLNNNIYFISCGYPFNSFYNKDDENNEQNNSIEISNSLKNSPNLIFDINFNRYLSIKFSPSLSYHIKKNKRIIELSNYILKENENILNEIKYEKIKLTLYSSDNFSISNNIKKIMQNYYQKNITKYLQLFISFKNAELTPSIDDKKNKNEKYTSIEKFTLFFQTEEESNSLFCNRIIYSILFFFPSVKIISFKNIDFKNDKQKFRENFDDTSEYLEMMLFGEKNKDIVLFKNKENCLKEIKFYNCYICNNIITKDILDDIQSKINSALGKDKIKIILSE